MSRATTALALALLAASSTGCGSDIGVRRSGCPEFRYPDLDGDGYGDPNSGVQGDPKAECAFPAGWVEDSSDCNDADAQVHPATVWHPDADADGYGDAATPVQACDPGPGHVLDASDCDDGDATLNPETLWFRDSDSDSFGDPTDTTAACAAPSGYVADDTDCDDGDASRNPGAAEVCDAIDNDCDDLVDADDPTLDPSTRTAFFPDGDGDTFGDDAGMLLACRDARPTGWVEVGGDCDDALAPVHPGADEECDGIDNNCDTLIDDADPLVLAVDTYYADVDGDGFGDPAAPLLACIQGSGVVSDATDCDDAGPNTYPGAAPADSPTACMKDGDGDGFGDDAPGGAVTAGTDCDDTSERTHPGAAFNDSTFACMRDVDEDDWGDDSPPPGVGVGTDCSDTNPAASPSQAELCTTLYDDDCDGEINEPGAADALPFFNDGDGDGYGIGAPNAACVPPPGTAPVAGDCDDVIAAVFPGAPEYCNGRDDDCNGTDDDDYALDALPWYADGDGDGHGSDTPSATACANPDPLQYSSATGDCDDADPGVYPGATEVCDGVRNDCALVAWTDAAEDGLISFRDTSGAWTDETTAIDWSNPAIPTTYRVDASGTLKLCRGDFYGTIAVNGPYAVTVEGQHGPSETTLHGNATSRILEAMQSGGSLTVRGLTLEDGTANYAGTIDARQTSLLIEDCEVRNSSTSQAGGAVRADNLTSLVVRDSLFEGNTAVTNGGAFFLTNGTSGTFERVTFRNNHATAIGRTGGAIHAEAGASWHVVDSTFDGNTAQHGGAVSATSTAAPSSSQTSTFTGNSAVTEGGAVRAQAAYDDDGSSFIGNDALRGGALHLTNGVANTLVDSIVQGNDATDGAGLYVAGAGSAVQTLDTVQVLENVATGLGGGVYLSGAPGTLQQTDVLRNQAASGGGVYMVGATLSATTCDLGTGIDDNIGADDVTVSDVPATYTYGDAVSFTCSGGGCF